MKLKSFEEFRDSHYNESYLKSLLHRNPLLLSKVLKDLRNQYKYYTDKKLEKYTTASEISRSLNML